MAGRRGTEDTQLDDLLQGTDAALRSALRNQRGRLENKDLLAARLWTLLIDRIVKEWQMDRPLAERIMDRRWGISGCAAPAQGRRSVRHRSSISDGTFSFCTPASTPSSATAWPDTTSTTPHTTTPRSNRGSGLWAVRAVPCQ
jgi:hypothetical protein